MPNSNAAGSHSGDSTHSHDQAMISASLSPMNRIDNDPMKNGKNLIVMFPFFDTCNHDLSR